VTDSKAAYRTRGGLAGRRRMGGLSEEEAKIIKKKIKKMVKEQKNSEL
jgi:lactam utilization protein B